MQGSSTRCLRCPEQAQQRVVGLDVREIRNGLPGRRAEGAGRGFGREESRLDERRRSSEPCSQKKLSVQRSIAAMDSADGVNTGLTGARRRTRTTRQSTPSTRPGEVAWSQPHLALHEKFV